MAKRFLLTIIIMAGIAGAAYSQNYFQNNRKAFQKAKYSQTTKRYSRACDIFEKKRNKTAKKPLITLGRKRKPKLAEQN